MFARTLLRRAGNDTYGGWPWPVKLPFKSDWYHRLSRRESIADETRQYTVVGDFLLLSIVGYSIYRVYQLYFETDAYQTHLSHLNQFPPALIANEFDFKDVENNRKVTRAVLDEYREAAATCRVKRQPLENVIFKY